MNETDGPTPPEPLRRGAGPRRARAGRSPASDGPFPTCRPARGYANGAIVSWMHTADARRGGLHRMLAVDAVVDARRKCTAHPGLPARYRGTRADRSSPRRRTYAASAWSRDSHRRVMDLSRRATGRPRSATSPMTTPTATDSQPRRKPFADTNRPTCRTTPPSSTGAASVGSGRLDRRTERRFSLASRRPPNTLEGEPATTMMRRPALADNDQASAPAAHSRLQVQEPLPRGTRAGRPTAGRSRATPASAPRPGSYR